MRRNKVLPISCLIWSLILLPRLLFSQGVNLGVPPIVNFSRQEFKAGTLHPDDADYIAALHARVTGEAATADSADLYREPNAEPERLDGLDISAWRDRALAAEAELAVLKDQMASPASL